MFRRRQHDSSPFAQQEPRFKLCIRLFYSSSDFDPEEQHDETGSAEGHGGQAHDGQAQDLQRSPESGRIIPPF